MLNRFSFHRTADYRGRKTSGSWANPYGSLNAASTWTSHHIRNFNRGESKCLQVVRQLSAHSVP